MKYLLIVLFFVSAAAAADFDADDQKYCVSIGELAKTISYVRQDGAVMSDIVSNCLSADDAGAQRICLAMVKDSFDNPRMMSDTYRSRAISEFGNEWYLACFNARNK